MPYFQHLKPFLKCFLYIFLNVVIILVKINLYLFSDSWVFHCHDECHLNHFKYLDFIIREDSFWMEKTQFSKIIQMHLAMAKFSLKNPQYYWLFQMSSNVNSFHCDKITGFVLFWPKNWIVQIQPQYLSYICLVNFSSNG